MLPREKQWEKTAVDLPIRERTGLERGVGKEPTRTVAFVNREAALVRDLSEQASQIVCSRVAVEA